ncbi:MAG: glycerate kinase [Acidimicrobiales bacterium]
MPRLVAAPDKFRGTATAAEVAAAMGRAAAAAGWACVELPMADGGEGLLDALGGRRRRTRVSGPLGRPVVAEWRLIDELAGSRGPTAVLEMARASGLTLAGGPEGNAPVDADTKGTGDLVLAALAAGARRIVVGCGGSATTDGGLGAVRVIGSRARLGGAELVVACDVTTLFEDAAAVFASQKGASAAQSSLLTGRLRRLAQLYREEHGVDVSHLAGGGAAGGLAGGLAALGGRLVSGFALVAEAVGLAEELASADLVVTGEGYLDDQSFDGKVVGGVSELAAAAGAPVLCVVGDADGGTRVAGARVVRLVEAVGAERARTDVVRSVEEVVSEHLAGLPG